MFSIVELRSEWVFELSFSAYICFLVGGITVWILLSSRGELWLPRVLGTERGMREAGGCITCSGLALAEVCTWMQIGSPVMSFGCGRTD